MLCSIRTTAILTAMLCSAHAVAQDGAVDEAPDEDVDRSPQACIIVSRIDQTDALDDNTIVFDMRGRGNDYVNYLPRRCPNLARENRFAYQVRASRLCEGETITVLEFGGRRSGFTCRLGEFQPVTPEEIEELERIAEQGGRDAIEVEEVELPEDEGGENGSESQP